MGLKVMKIIWILIWIDLVKLSFLFFWHAQSSPFPFFAFARRYGRLYISFSSFDGITFGYLLPS